MRIFNGKKAAEEILLRLKEKILKDKITPTLSVISIGKDPASELFIRNKKKAARRIGIKVNHYKFKETVSEKEIIRKIEELNSDDTVNGIIVQLPLPPKLNVRKILREISPRKDVDGFHKRTHFSSPLILGILTAIKDSAKDLKDKNIIALVNSDFFGKVLKSFLREKAIKVSYLKTKRSPKIKTADIIITVRGCPNSIKGDMIKEGAILIDGGIVVSKNKKVIGDVDKRSVAKKARFLTPVPGGLGPLTVAFLLKNIYLAKNDFRHQ